ncbi:molybdenum cofactor biosynthesis protein [Campylobacter estrildidarum]|uniref:Molybdenum cofactor biosynthesis protein n=1 Tax=Campylobacter estrildidarum TaxID=2510189 RepID=A0A4U7BM63_9BACT|nr:molybdenum cofactor biosynthesis protein [Campylobacter estrildidarum]TKX29966.1 molybdenum cofactor biosynthesis protein [Campylobacter estrildidarum]
MFKKKTTQKQILKAKVSFNDAILDDRLFEFTKKIQKISKNEDSASLLARQLSKLIKANKY